MRVPRKSRFGILTTCTALLAIPGFSQGPSNDPAIRKAQEQVEHNIHTREGKMYDGTIGKEFEEKYPPIIRSCGRQTPAEERKPFTLYVQYAEDGKVEAVLLDPANSFTACIRGILLKDAFSKPPAKDYWVQVTVDFRK